MLPNVKSCSDLDLKAAEDMHTESTNALVKCLAQELVHGNLYLLIYEVTVSWFSLVFS